MQNDEFDSNQLDAPPALAPSGTLGALTGTFGDMFASIPVVYRKLLESSAIKLIGAGADLCTTKIRQITKDIDQKQATKDEFRKELMNQAKNSLSQRPELVERAANHYVDEIIGKQIRRENVVGFAMEDLAHTPPPPEGQAESQQPSAESLDEDWLTGLQRHAENATSERMQRMFGRILAGEIRQPGSFNLFTLDVISKLSPADAANITTIAPFVVGDILLRSHFSPEQISYNVMAKLGHIGILDPGTVSAIPINRTFPLNREPQFDPVLPEKFSAICRSREKTFIFVSDDNSNVVMSGARVTAVGVEIISLHACDHDEGMLRRWAAALKSEKQELYVSDYTALPQGRFALNNIKKIEPAAE